MIDISIDYKLANLLIAHLAADPDLSSMVYDEVLDSTSQAATLRIASRAHQSCLCVSTGDATSNTEDASSRTGVMDIHLIVSLLSVGNVTSYPEPHRSLISYTTSVLARVIKLIGTWEPDGYGIPYTRPRALGTQDMDLSRIPALTNVSGRAVIIACPIKF